MKRATALAIVCSLMLGLAPTTGAQFNVETKLTASDGVGIGNSVGISGGTAIVGAVGDDYLGFATGTAYLFDVATGNQLFKLTASDAAADNQFGWSVGISGGVAIVGARFDDDAGGQSGSAYLFDVATGKQSR